MAPCFLLSALHPKSKATRSLLKVWKRYSNNGGKKAKQNVCEGEKNACKKKSFQKVAVYRFDEAIAMTTDKLAFWELFQV